MKPSDALTAHRAAVRHTVAASCARNPRVFGSEAREEDTEGSDLDMLGVEVDLLTPGDLPARFRDEVIREAVPV